MLRQAIRRYQPRLENLEDRCLLAGVVGPSAGPLRIPNDPPILGPVATQYTPQDTPAVFTLTRTDLENDPAEYEASLQPDSAANATVAVVNNADGTGTVTVTANPGYIGPLSLLVGVKDQGATTRGSASDPFDTQLVTIGVGDQALTGWAFDCHLGWTDPRRPELRRSGAGWSQLS